MEERRDFRSYIRPEKLNEETPEPKKKKRKMAGDCGPLGTVAHNIGRILLYYAVPFIGSLIGLPIMLGAYDFIILPIFLFIFYHIISKKTCSDMNAAAMSRRGRMVCLILGLPFSAWMAQTINPAP